MAVYQFDGSFGYLPNDKPIPTSVNAKLLGLTPPNMQFNVFLIRDVLVGDNDYNSAYVGDLVTKKFTKELPEHIY